MTDVQWAQETAERIKRKMEKVAERNRGKIPYTSENGIFNDMKETDIYWWTNGFWGGMMWQLYHATGKELYREIAQETEEKLLPNLLSCRGMDHDTGFKWLPTAAANYRLTGNEKSLERVLAAAASLAGRFNPAGQFIRAWNDNGDGSNAGIAIIDCMMNLPLLYQAYEKTNDARFLQIATAHAQTAKREFVREDGSVHHIVEFDAVTGERKRSLGGQGFKEGSSWTRGQAWGLYGFCLSYLHTKQDSYLQTAKKIAHYFIANIPESGLIPVAFRQPESPAWEDSTAAAIAACGLLEIEKQVGEYEKKIYRNAALKLLKTLAGKRCCFDENVDYLLEKCTAAYHDENHEFSIIYGDYFFVEAIWKLTGEETFIW